MTDRTNLRFAGYRLRDAKNHAKKVVPLPNALLDAIESAEQALAEAIEPLLVKLEGYEPLNEDEEIIFDKLQHVLRFDNDMWSKTTNAQRFSAARVINRQGGPDKIRHPVSGGAFGDTMIGISFDHIFIGIETDGYAHS